MLHPEMFKLQCITFENRQDVVARGHLFAHALQDFDENNLMMTSCISVPVLCLLLKLMAFRCKTCRTRMKMLGRAYFDA
jgi:hypothetical protein